MKNVEVRNAKAHVEKPKKKPKPKKKRVVLLAKVNLLAAHMVKVRKRPKPKKKRNKNEKSFLLKPEVQTYFGFFISNQTG